MKPTIIDRGRGPEITGSRITVYDVLAETEAGATPEELAQWYGLSVEAIHVALRYIEEHREEVLADWRKIQERIARGNPPELQARLDATHARFMARYGDRLKLCDEERNGEGDSGGQ